MNQRTTKTQLRVRTQVRGGFSVEECKAKCWQKHTSANSPDDLWFCQEQCDSEINPNKKS